VQPVALYTCSLQDRSKLSSARTLIVQQLLLYPSKLMSHNSISMKKCDESANSLSLKTSTMFSCWPSQSLAIARLSFARAVMSTMPGRWSSFLANVYYSYFNFQVQNAHTFSVRILRSYNTPISQRFSEQVGSEVTYFMNGTRTTSIDLSYMLQPCVASSGPWQVRCALGNVYHSNRGMRHNSGATSG
jgi:hypothetical protein